MTTTKQNWKLLASAAMVSLALSGCGSDGSDGSNGEDGKPGPVGIHISESPTVVAHFTDAQIENGTVTVEFTLENANGVGLYGLTKDDDLRFGIAQLAHVTEAMPGAEEGVEQDRGYQWQAYINSEKQPGDLPEDTTHLNPSAQFQAGVEKASSCEDCLTDHGNGTYTYTYQINVASVTEPLEVVYNGEATHRATLELELPQTVANGHYDWQPSTGMTDDIQTRDVVSIEACYTCHQPDSLALHGGRRIDIENCASCHTATSGDPESGNSVDFTYMIHAIHKGKDRKTYAPDHPDADAKGMIPAPYIVIGYKGSEHDYSKVMYPQKPAADCAACHVEGEGAPADAALFKADKSNEACIACHTTNPKKYHDPENRDCISCHVAEGYARSAEEAHGDVMKSYNASLGYSAEFSKVKAENGVLTFDVQILDDKGEAVAKEFIANPSMYTKSSIYISWDIEKDYPTYQDGSKYSDRGFALTDEQVSSYNETTKTFSISSANRNLVLPDEMNGQNVELYAGVATCFKKGGYGRPVVEPIACDSTESEVTFAYIQDEPLRFVWNGVDTTEAATERREIIDVAKCQGCHNQEIVHYDNGVNCQACHTPDKGLSYGATKEPTSFAYKAHHAEGHYLKYGGAGTGTVLKTDCSTCHAKTDKVDGIALGRAPERVWRYADANGQDLWVSSDAGACLSCHMKYLSDSGKAHIETYGAVLSSDKAFVEANAAESCATCHNPDQIRALHGN
ncbi:decaheme c-type cytochrome, OmcA/MtrC family [Ferrimonas balearica DSM 9799]|uniref:Decaheme c-type cytochrome, OmcA/MtrC family n=1 Tax=Ferrimonas balearica (strain DSM 9799 / CCM 4581 / KCTC 23876 / PAT) TaxID=550540 RepID=E1SMM4_FERBD|nr:OmcA/MtrC family decaheme c-type cytochrome [Ferrimonas balearica]ADN75563.1 decaheme c-type cytochrome, OmcA/MtrC family [Ferrimonas balearica DSM 9799]